MQIEQEIYKLRIDDEFKRLIPQLSDKEREQLEKNIIQDGCRDAICVWHKTIVDGHNRYEICTEHKIPFAIKQLNFPNRAVAMVWICANQLGRRNIDAKTRQYLIGKRYEMEKIIGAHNAAGANQYTQKKEVTSQNATQPKPGESALWTRERLGKEYRVDPATVVRYGSYAQAMDDLSEIVPEMHEKLMSGQLKITQQDIVNLAKLRPDEIRQAVAEFTEKPTRRINFSETSATLPKNMPLAEKLEKLQMGAVKIMPEYDPDAEISSLAFTVPSWTSSINRVRSSAKFNEVSDGACERLNASFYELKTAIDAMLAVIKERK